MEIEWQQWFSDFRSEKKTFKGIESLPLTQIFKFLYLSNLMLEAFDLGKLRLVDLTDDIGLQRIRKSEFAAWRLYFLKRKK